MPFAPPSLQESAVLSHDTCEEFRRRGFCHLPSFLDPEELLFFEGALSSLVEKHYDREAAFSRNTDLYARAFQQVSNLWRRSDEAKAFVFSRRLASAAAKLLGVRRVRL